MQESDSTADGISALRRWIIWAAVIGTALWAGYFFIFLIYQSIFGSAASDNWFLRMVQEHPAATIGVAMSAITAFCLVALLEIARGPIEFEAMGFKFKGASGPVILWVFCFLAMIFGVWILWDKIGSSEWSQETVSINQIKPHIILTQMSVRPGINSKHQVSLSGIGERSWNLTNCHITNACSRTRRSRAADAKR